MATIYKIADRNNDPFLDAAIELDANAVILHSRGGATGKSPPRNSEYEEALRVIIRRLRNSQRTSITQVLLDSAPARARPSNERILVARQEMVAVTDDGVISLIRSRARKWGQKAGTRGGNSTKQVRIEVTPISHLDLRSTLLLQVGQVGRKGPRASSALGPAQSAKKVNRLPYSEQQKVTSAQINGAVDILSAGGDAPHFRDSKDYDLITTSGIRLAPKKVFALALEEALGFPIYPGHFSGGRDQPSFRLIRSAGYLILPKLGMRHAGTKRIGRSIPLPSPDEDREWAEGNPKRTEHLKRERAPGLSAKKKADFHAQHGKLFCERCGFEPAGKYGFDYQDAGLDVHHTVPLSSAKPGHKTTLAQLELLCATCHRVEHRRLALAKRTKN